MFHRLGNLVTRHWAVVIFAWLAAVAGLKLAQQLDYAPRWDEVTLDGDLEFLPAETTSVRGMRLLRRAFPADRAKSQVVIVLARRNRRLTVADRTLARRIANTLRGRKGDLPILDVWTPATEVVGSRLVSPDRRAMLIVIPLGTELTAVENMRLLDVLQQQVVAAGNRADPGLEIGITGSAAIGADMLRSAAESIHNTETYALVLVALILLIVYRAPLLVLVPLLTIATSIWVAMDLVALVSRLGQQLGPDAWSFHLFKTTKIFVVVLLYGAGTDYCLFLTARYKEELGRGHAPKRAVADALGHVGEALAASALTTIVGLATMWFADFGKFSSSGPAIAICLSVTLVACISLAPALLCASGRWIFWPLSAVRRSPQHATGACGGRPVEQRTSRSTVWPWLSDVILGHPATILAASLLILLPLARRGWSVEVTYDLLSELGPERPSVRGTVLLRRHFPAGETGPVTVLAFKRGAHFDTRHGRHQIGLLTKRLDEIDGVSRVRSIAAPMGNRPGSVQPFTRSGLAQLAARTHRLTKARYVAQDAQYKGKIARFDVVLQCDPFSQAAIDRLDEIDRRLTSLAANPTSPWYGTQFDFLGTTAGIRDLRQVTDSDRRLIERLVVLAVLTVLLVILRRPLICGYLIASVLLSYLVTIGVTEAFFQLVDGPAFRGLDWKVPLFLFVILVAVGEDYNIYLTTRVFEEQRRRGARDGLRHALIQTGGIITSCGVIMAGTFASMMTGSLRGTLELGFALTLGVLLDTFVIRTVLVPAFLALLIARRADLASAHASPQPSRTHGTSPPWEQPSPLRKP